MAIAQRSQLTITVVAGLGHWRRVDCELRDVECTSAAERDAIQSGRGGAVVFRWSGGAPR